MIDIEQALQPCLIHKAIEAQQRVAKVFDEYSKPVVIERKPHPLAKSQELIDAVMKDATSGNFHQFEICAKYDVSPWFVSRHVGRAGRYLKKANFMTDAKRMLILRDKGKISAAEAMAKWKVSKTTIRTIWTGE